MVDDGLDAVCDCLHAEGIEFDALRGSAIPSGAGPPLDLFISNARHAELVRNWPGISGASPWPLRVAVVGEDSAGLRAALRQLGFHYLVRSSVHPAALRLFLRSSLYSGVERRAEPRIPVDLEVTVRSRLRSRGARLIDLSAGGCSVLTDYALRAGAVISIVLPDSAGRSERELVLPARVMNSAPWGSAVDKRVHSGLRFVRLGQLRSSELRRRLETVALQKPRSRSAARAGPRATPVGPGGERRRRERRNGERRRSPRSLYRRSVVASLPHSVHRIVLGRELSSGGMRIEPHADLAEGDPLRLAIYGDSDDQLVVVNAVVIRDEGGAGLALQFRGVSQQAAQIIEAIAGHLPPIERLDEGEALGAGTVISERLEPPRR